MPTPLISVPVDWTTPPSLLSQVVHVSYRADMQKGLVYCKIVDRVAMKVRYLSAEVDGVIGRWQPKVEEPTVKAWTPMGDWQSLQS